MYFGGVAFKYQRHVEAVGHAARIASRYMDVVTTSGPGTGRAAEVEKIFTMKEALGDFTLAIASGITPENVTAYLPYADCFLVATGISHDFNNLDPARTKTLVDTVRDGC
jgi:predicted TIM-barrel enzyme